MAYRTTSGQIAYTVTLPSPNSLVYLHTNVHTYLTSPQAYPVPTNTPHSTPQQSTLPIHTTNYDSDGEPLLPSTIRSHNYAELSEEERSRFTATGRPIPSEALSKVRSGSLQSWSGDMFTQPRFLPVQYTDDSIIPAIVTGVKRSVPPPPIEGQIPPKKRRHSLAGLFKGDRKEEDTGKGITKVVFMPRREYLRFFAKDEKGDYIGSEPKREWTEAELEETFGKYKPNYGKERRGSAAGRLGSMSGSVLVNGGVRA